MAFIISLVFIQIFSFILLNVNPENKSNRRASLVSILIIPTTLFGWLYHLFHPIFNSPGTLLIPLVIFCILYGCFLIRHELFDRNNGLTGRFQDNKSPDMSGGDVLRHALKNELAKISLCGRNIEASGPKFDADTFRQFIGENARNIQASTDYLLILLNRIHDFTREISIVESRSKLLNIIEDAIRLERIDLQTKNINIKRNYIPEDMNFFCGATPFT